MMTAQEVTLRVRERIGSAPLYVSYQSDGRESAWMQKQLELGCRMFHITIDSRQMAELFHEMLLIHLNILQFSDSRPDLKRNFKIQVTLRNENKSSYKIGKSNHFFIHKNHTIAIS